MAGNSNQRGWRSEPLAAAAVALAIVGLSLAALAAAEDQPTVRTAGYPASTCDNPGQSFDTKITMGPKGTTRSTKAKINFEGFYCSSPGSKLDQALLDFDCRLDRKKSKSCSSPVVYKRLKKGKHKFKVATKGFKAFPGSGGDPSPAVAKWKIKKKKG